jgi:hypothetical protein
VANTGGAISRDFGCTFVAMPKHVNIPFRRMAEFLTIRMKFRITRFRLAAIEANLI